MAEGPCQLHDKQEATNHDVSDLGITAKRQDLPVRGTQVFDRRGAQMDAEVRLTRSEHWNIAFHTKSS